KGRALHGFFSANNSYEQLTLFRNCGIWPRVKQTDMSDENPLNESTPETPSTPTGGKSANADYSQKDLEHLSDLEHVRERPSMYIGDTTARGLHHLVYEVVDNSI